jgi:hypothetical protein
MLTQDRPQALVLIQGANLRCDKAVAVLLLEWSTSCTADEEVDIMVSLSARRAADIWEVVIAQLLDDCCSAEVLLLLG